MVESLTPSFYNRGHAPIARRPMGVFLSNDVADGLERRVVDATADPVPTGDPTR
jgi:hypothetical protein